MSDFYEQVLAYLTTHGAIFALLQVILIDLVMAGDNAVVIGMAAARLPAALRHKVIFWGLAGAVVLRVLMATVTVELFGFVPLRVVGGILLLWVAWRLYRDMRHAKANPHAIEENGQSLRCSPELAAPGGGNIVMRRAIMQITVADISMSLDNVLAVAGAAIHHVWVLAVGLVLSIGLMGVAANLVAKLLIVLYVALAMIYRGGMMMASTP